MNDNLYVIIISLIVISINIYQAECVSDGKGCHFNDAIFNPKIFHNNAYWKCYEAFSDRNRLQKVYCLVEHDSYNFTVPGFVVREKCIPFDYRSSSISSLVQSSLTNETYTLWIKCCQDAEQCCKQMLENYYGENFFNTCDAHWDGISCFRETYPGETVEMACPYHIKKNDESSCEYTYSKACQPNGTWTKSDFTQCYPNERQRNYAEWHLSIISITLIFCLPPILSFLFCKSCHGKHLKALVALILFVTLRSILKLALVSMIYTDSSTLTINSLTCKTLVALAHFTASMSYACLSMITLKLLQIVKNSSSGSWGMFMLMSMSLLLSILSTIIWSFAMKIFSNKLCWTEDNGFHWIYDGVRILILLVALLFFGLCICHRCQQYDKHLVRFIKLITIPLVFFILPIIISITPSIFGECGWKDAYKFTQEFFELLQALSLCIIYFIPIPKTSLKLKSWSSTKNSSQNSNASLAPSRLSHNHKDDTFSNWYDAVTLRNSTACYDNDIVYENISTLPEPYKTDNNEIVNYNQTNQQRHTIRQVMLRAKRNLSHAENIVPKQCSTPPIPKIIPNQILDDVQLFDAYYRSLDSFCDKSDSIEASSGSKEAHKRISIKNIGKVFMIKNNQHKNFNADAASNDC